MSHVPAAIRLHFSSRDHRQDLLRERDDDPACQGQESIGPLRWVM